MQKDQFHHFNHGDLLTFTSSGVYKAENGDIWEFEYCQGSHDKLTLLAGGDYIERPVTATFEVNGINGKGAP